jgi:hypothetical protein
VLGEEDAAVLISHLPPSGWSDVARTRDLESLETRIEARLARLEERADGRFAAVDARFERFESIVAARFDASDARADARLERAMREQLARVLVGMGAMLTIFGAVQALLS